MGTEFATQMGDFFREGGAWDKSNKKRLADQASAISERATTEAANQNVADINKRKEIENIENQAKDTAGRTDKESLVPEERITPKLGTPAILGGQEPKQNKKSNRPEMKMAQGFQGKTLLGM